MMDTGCNAPESRETLLAQQRQLILGFRIAQMFPKGTDELELPEGMGRYENHRGVFHYRRERISFIQIAHLSIDGKENEILLLGPYSKPEIIERHLKGEPFVTVTEYDSDGVELRSALGVTSTTDRQLEYFESTKEPGSEIVVGMLPARVGLYLKGRLQNGH